MSSVKMSPVASSVPFSNTNFTSTDTQSAIVEAAGDIWNGTSQVTRNLIRFYTNIGTTDSNGRITFIVTTDGTTGTSALFSQIYTVNPVGGPNTFTAVNAPNFYVESVSVDLKTIVIRATTGVNLLALGSTQAFAGSGVKGYITIIGAK